MSHKLHKTDFKTVQQPQMKPTCFWAIQLPFNSLFISSVWQLQKFQLKEEMVSTLRQEITIITSGSAKKTEARRSKAGLLELRHTATRRKDWDEFPAGWGQQASQELLDRQARHADEWKGASMWGCWTQSQLRAHPLLQHGFRVNQHSPGHHSPIASHIIAVGLPIASSHWLSPSPWLPSLR